MIFCLVRTDKDVRPQEGISFLLIDMTTPGVEVRPINRHDPGAAAVALRQAPVMIDHQFGDEDHHLQRYIALAEG